MKNLIKSFLVILLGILTFAGCKTEKEKNRKEFLKNIESYSSDAKRLVEERRIGPGNYSFAAFKKGAKISYVLSDTIYRGVLEEKTIFLGNGSGQFKMRNGAILTNASEYPSYSYFELIQIDEGILRLKRGDDTVFFNKNRKEISPR